MSPALSGDIPGVQPCLYHDSTRLTGSRNSTCTCKYSSETYKPNTVFEYYHASVNLDNVHVLCLDRNVETSSEI